MKRKLDFFPPDRRAILEKFGFITAFAEGSLSIKEFHQDLKSLSESMEREGIQPYEIKVLEFWPGDERSSIILSGRILPFEKYGLPEDEMVQISPESATFNERVVFNEESEQEYQKLLATREISMNDLLKRIGFIVNNSMSYDFERARITAKDARSKEGWDEIQKKYVPSGKETMHGICTDAGFIIRRILEKMHLPKKYKVWIAASLGEVMHSLTVVKNLETERWTVLNSKSPNKDYLIVPKERLGVLGVIGVTIEQRKSPFYS
jgi:hypothetical protein